MNRLTIRSRLLLGAALAGTTFSAPAFAQDAASETVGDNDIIVTAQRVEQRLQDVPISITVFSQQQLTQRNITVASDLSIYTPSLSTNQRYGPEKSSFSIRGFNQDQSTAPTVGVYFAEVVGVRAQGGTTSGNTVGAGTFTDLSNVQILKGPQGTLFGRNTTGGAVMLTPTKPTDRLEGFVEGTYGNFDQIKATGVLNLPLAETFRVRLAVERNKRDGFLRNLSGRGPKDYNDVNYLYARLSIVADLTPDLENYTIFHYSNSDTNGYGTKMIGCANASTPNPLIGFGRPGFNTTRYLQATSCAIQVARQTARGDGFYDIETRNLNPFLKIETWQAINTTTWQASDTITLKNTMSYGEFRERANFDLGSSNFITATDPAIQNPAPNGLGIPAGVPYDRTTLDTAGDNSQSSGESTFTEELQLQGHTDWLDFVIGGYLEFSRPLGWSENRTGSLGDCTRPQTIDCVNTIGLLSISESSTRPSFDNHGVFGQATWKVTDKLSLTGGLRYTFDKIVSTGRSTRARFTPNNLTGAPFVDPIGGKTIYRACTDSFRHFNDPVRPSIDRSVCFTTLTNKSSKPTWLVNVDYKFTPDLMAYAKYARGYRQGGINFTNVGLETWRPEKLDSYELGIKATFRGAVSGYLNLAGFYNNLTDQQVFGSLIPSQTGIAQGVSGGAAIINAGKSRIYGFEVEGAATFFDALRVQAGYTYLNTQVKQVAAAATVGDGSALGQALVGTPFQSITPTVSAGSSFILTPEHKFTISPSYTLDLGEGGGEVTLGATWVHQSSYLIDGTSPAYLNGMPLGIAPATDLVNLNLDWKSVAGSPIDLSLFVTNLTKEKYNVSNTNAWISNGVAEVMPNQPRFYGVRVRYTFGS